MLIALWILNALLALAFLAAGLLKLTRPREALVSSGQAWADDFSGRAVKVIGALEAIGALGLILPIATGIVPVLSAVAATGLAVLMIAATVVHVRRSEPPLSSAILAVLAIASAVLGFLTLT
jgi:uncharacterized membrane protein